MDIDTIIHKKGIFRRIQENMYESECKKYIIFDGFLYTWRDFYYDRKIKIGNSVVSNRLHRAVWSFYNGEIPEGFHVHHIDKDRRNNKIENLQLLSEYDHLSLHAKDKASWSNSEKCKKLLLSVQGKSKEWHASKEGYEWHREHAYKSLPVHTGIKYEKKCGQCNKAFMGNTKFQRFCGNNCKSLFRRNSKIDHIEFVCSICSIVFMDNKYNKRKTCSNKCGVISAAKVRSLRNNGI